VGFQKSLDDGLPFAKMLSGSRQEVLYRLRPLSVRGVIAGDFTWPGTRQVLWGSDEEDDLLAWVRRPNLLVEFERFLRGVSAKVKHQEIVDIGLPEKSCGGNLFSFMHLDSVTSQDGSAYLTRSLAAVDEENFFAKKWWRAIHTTLPKRARPFYRKGDSDKVCAEKGRESIEISGNLQPGGRFLIHVMFFLGEDPVEQFVSEVFDFFIGMPSSAAISANVLRWLRRYRYRFSSSVKCIVLAPRLHPSRLMSPFSSKRLTSSWGTQGSPRIGSSQRAPCSLSLSHAKLCVGFQPTCLWQLVNKKVKKPVVEF